MQACFLSALTVTWQVGSKEVAQGPIVALGGRSGAPKHRMGASGDSEVVLRPLDLSSCRDLLALLFYAFPLDSRSGVCGRFAQTRRGAWDLGQDIEAAFVAC